MFLAHLYGVWSLIRDPPLSAVIRMPNQSIILSPVAVVPPFSHLNPPPLISSSTFNNQIEIDNASFQLLVDKNESDVVVFSLSLFIFVLLTNSANPTAIIFSASSNPFSFASVYSPSHLFHAYSLLVMALDVLPSCSSPHDPIGSLIEKLAAASLFGQGSLCFSASAASSSSAHPPSPPPTGAARNFNRLSGSSSSRKYDASVPREVHRVSNAVAVAVLMRLHQWCCRLFWLTIVCLLGYYSDEQQRQQFNSEGGKNDRKADDGGAAETAEQQQRRAFREVRKSIVQVAQRHGSKKLADLEMQLLRHLTSPQTAVLRPMRFSNHKRRHFLSRPPSPQLFDISEENDEQ